jgi:RNA polymerase sigma factor (sigma-70 family)
MILPSAQAWSNARVVEECLRGNERAWHMLLDRYKNLIYSIPFKYGVPPEDAADIFQSVCLDLFNELSRVRDAEALAGWLIRVTHHKCYHWKRRREALAEESDEDTLELAGDEPVPPDMLAELEREQQVRDALASLSPRCQEVIELLFFEQPPLPYADVAQRLRLARGSIAFMRGSCLKRLKTILEKKGF